MSDAGDDHTTTWTRIETRRAFLSAFGDRPPHGDGAVFVIHSSGTLTGAIGTEVLAGTWVWRGGLFCRRARLGGVDLGRDCEVIERRGAEMRYTGDGGRAAPRVVSLTPPGAVARR